MVEGPNLGKTFQPDVRPIIPQEIDEASLLSPTPSTERRSGRWNWKRIGIIAGGSTALAMAAALHVVALPNMLVLDVGTVSAVAYLLTGQALLARREGVSLRAYLSRPVEGSDPVSGRDILATVPSVAAGVGSMLLASKLLGG